MTTELALPERYDEMHRVITLHLEGRNAAWIAKNLGMKPKDVLNYIQEFKEIAKSDDLLRARAQEVVHEFDQQHNRIIASLWDVVEEAESATDGLKTRATALKSLSDISAKRVEVLQKSGLLSDAALGDEMAEMEDRQDKLIAILREVTSDCNHCKFEVHRRLQQIDGKVVPVKVEAERE
jgi:predicted translin family RNA/ssDNA-binding protein